MRNLVLIISLCCISSASNAHDYFFGFAEVEYNEMTNRCEISLSFTGHDFEKAMLETHPEFGTLEAARDDSMKLIRMEDYINQHFRLGNSTPAVHLKLMGIEINANGIVNFYLESNEIVLNDKLDVSFDMLMETFPEQQNKLTFYCRENSTTMSFLPHQKSNTIELKKD